MTLFAIVSRAPCIHIIAIRRQSLACATTATVVMHACNEIPVFQYSEIIGVPILAWLHANDPP